MTQDALPDSSQERIRLEEAFRLEVRRELDVGTFKNRPWKLFNSPFGIWILSTVVLGLLSWGYRYTVQQESQHLANEERAAAVFFETHFRIKQMENVLAQAQTSEPLRILPVFAGIKLGGIGSFPLNDEAIVWVNGSGTGNRALPSGRGFQNQDFSGYSLVNLWYSYRFLTCDERPSKEEVAVLSQMLKRLDRMVTARVEEKEATFERVRAAWLTVLKHLTVFQEPGPDFECPTPLGSAN